MGSRSGSGRIIFEHFDRLSKIYGSSSAANRLATGIDSDTVNDGSFECMATGGDMVDEDSTVGERIDFD